MIKPKAIICGNYGAGNLGDEAILRAIVQELEPNYDLMIMSGNPSETEKNLNLPAINRLPSGFRSHLKAIISPNNRKETLKALKQCDKFILGGGTLLTDQPKASLLVWGTQVKGAIKAGAKLEIYANGIGPLNSTWSQKLVGRILNQASKISVRDKKSIKWAKKLTTKEITLAPDPVLNLNFKLNKITSHENTIIFAPRFWKKHSKNTEIALKKFIYYLCTEQGKFIVGIPFETNNKKDKALLNKILNQEGVKERSKIYSNYKTEEDVLQIIRSAQMVIGMRLHSLIFAHLMKTPFIGIAYMEKVTGLGEELKASEKIISLEDLTFENLKKIYDKLSSKLS